MGSAQNSREGDFGKRKKVSPSPAYSAVAQDPKFALNYGSH